jgi:hypothetical protein
MRFNEYMLLEEMIKTYYNKSEPVFLLEHPKEYEVLINGKPITFIGPDVTPDFNRIYCERRNDTTVLYYALVAGIMYNKLGVVLDDKIVVGSQVISIFDYLQNETHLNVFQVYKEFEQFLDAVDSDNVAAKTIEFFEGDFVNDGESAWDNLVTYLENHDNIDHEDIANFISPTFKQRLEAELQNRNMIKGLSPTKTLF